MKFRPSSWRAPEAGLQREWLLTNGLGGYASTSVTGANNRRYHGLLVAASPVGNERQFILSQISETVVSENSYRTLLSFHTRDQDYRGEECLRSFVWNGMPVWHYRVGSLSIEKQAVLVYGRNLTVIRYRFENGDEPVSFHMTPLVNYRNHHFLTYNQYAQYEVDFNGRQMDVHPFGSSDIIRITCSDGQVIRRDRTYFYNMDYPLERERGYPATEDHYIPGYYEIKLEPGASKVVTLAVSLNESLDDVDGDACIREEEFRLANLPFRLLYQDPFVHAMAQAADQFIVRHMKENDEVSIMAGYHWIGPWGRDSLVALPGLLLKSKRHADAAGLLADLAGNIRMGLLANPLLPEIKFNPDMAADGPLWFYETLFRYFQETGDLDFVRRMMPVLEDTFQMHALCRIRGMLMNEDGMLAITDGNAPLTWMNARIGNWVVTPRAGMVVEINALWYNALRVLAHFRSLVGASPEVEGRDAGVARTEQPEADGIAQSESGGITQLVRRTGADPSTPASELPDPGELADLIKRRFPVIFWNEAAKCLYDVAGCTPPDDHLRPNQILAMSLSFPVLEGDLARQSLETVYQFLYTPIGFRSLSITHNQFRAQYAGDQYAREGAMHQGTVWPWLIGPFVTAWRRNHLTDPNLTRFLLEIFQQMEDHLRDGCLGSITEVADGQFPHQPRGCVSQAWSVAEVLRSYIEDVLPFTGADDSLHSGVED